MQNVTDIERFVLAGKAGFTLKSEKTGAHFTYRVERADKGRGSVYFVSVLTGPNNETDFTYAGILAPNGPKFAFRQTAKSRLAANALSVVSFKWFWDRIVAGRLPEQCEMHHEGKCGRCSRTLTTPESIERGIGPECAEKIGIATAKPKRRSKGGSRPQTPALAMPAWLG